MKGRAMENLKPCPFCGGKTKYVNDPWLNGEPCYLIEHVDFKAAVKAKCPLEIGGYDTVDNLRDAWNERVKND